MGHHTKCIFQYLLYKSCEVIWIPWESSFIANNIYEDTCSARKQPWRILKANGMTLQRVCQWRRSGEAVQPATRPDWFIFQPTRGSSSSHPCSIAKFSATFIRRRRCSGNWWDMESLNGPQIKDVYLPSKWANFLMKSFSVDNVHNVWMYATIVALSIFVHFLFKGIRAMWWVLSFNFGSWAPTRFTFPYSICKFFGKALKRLQANMPEFLVSDQIPKWLKPNETCYERL